MKKQKACSSPLCFFNSVKPTVHPCIFPLCLWPCHLGVPSGSVTSGSPASGWESGEMKRVFRPLFLAGILSSAGLLLICCTNTS